MVVVVVCTWWHSSNTLNTLISPQTQQWLFLNRKVKSLYNQRKRPAKLAWTTTYRKMHRKVLLHRALLLCLLLLLLPVVDTA